ncbi:PP2C family protein-serine/threonine phosphatase [Haemophilus influenzae]|uniref:PP2C family protein-serine/threonine phosphatase n=1 Tax=Haemophilus influenzae TaxID=727 RepID=UPI0001A66010|nr:protein phosphatase 2C domain-containing protein [Haemophilus influenzae]MBK1413447.1 protein phosphatase 2C domain-containing protein [Haemophilus influenzae]MCK8898801.1 protein phosphatase 2C domain-containing protein [Haemophilus influenzae]MCK8934619.1 protein phosphatase 2C domain-containing protein [Haemophilus influenzae]MCK9041409.1 protein phosphatase 2C domain-containing protein [Haemophilus influenzae]MCK9043049.1 protein phosphatase 2C domain-containing protein [Haemophilus inf
MENFCEITFCQQIGSNKRHNQDALFNGEAVFQYKLKTAEKRLENRPHFIVGVADGISNSNRPEKASKLAMQLLSQMESISRQTIYDLQSSLSEELAEDYFGSATTFVAAEIDQITCKAKILSVGDSRAYLIDSQGKWQQISQDHSILSELLADFPDKKEEDFATIYGGVSSCLVADYSEFQDKIFYQEIEIQQGESLLLCSDGLTDGLSEEMREKIWKQYDNDKSRLTVCRKLIVKQIAYDDLSVIIYTLLKKF